MLNTEVRMKGNSPALFINGKQESANYIFLRNFGEEEIRRFADAGIRNFTFWTDLYSDSFRNYSEISRRIEAIVRIVPNARILPRVFLDGWSDSLIDWLAKHPSEGLLSDQGVFNKARPSYASDLWFDGPAKESFAGCLAHCEKEFPDNIAGYQPGIGACGELIYCWSVSGDYSPCFAAKFRKWSEKRFFSSIDRLNAQWHTNFHSFDDVVLPDFSVRCQNEHGFRFHEKHAYALAYETFMCELGIQRALDAAALCKKMTARKKLCGFFYGYVLGLNGFSDPVHDQVSAHGLLIELLKSPDIDFIASPFGYYDRRAGGSDYGQHPENSVLLHGKISFSEIDTRTHFEQNFVSVDTPLRGLINPTIEESREVMKRNFSYTLTNGLSSWWMELTGHEWFHHPEYMKVIAQSVKLSNRTISDDADESAAEAALFLDDRAQTYLSPDSSLQLNDVYYQHNELKHAGFPFETYLLDDLENVKKKFKLLIFMKCIRLTAKQTALIHERVRRDHSAILWLGSCGVLNDSSFSVDHVFHASGFRTRFRDGVIPSRFFLKGEHGTEMEFGGENRIPSNRFGTDGLKSLPRNGLLYFDDPDAEILAVSAVGNYPVLARKGSSLFCTAGALPGRIIARFAQKSGVHLYTKSSPAVYASRKRIAVHFVKADSPCELSLPPAFHGPLRDLFSGQTFVPENGKISLMTERVSTYLLEPCSGK